MSDFNESDITYWSDDLYNHNENIIRLYTTVSGTGSNAGTDKLIAVAPLVSNDFTYSINNSYTSPNDILSTINDLATNVVSGLTKIASPLSVIFNDLRNGSGVDTTTKNPLLTKVDSIANSSSYSLNEFRKVYAGSTIAPTIPTMYILYVYGFDYHLGSDMNPVQCINKLIDAVAPPDSSESKGLQDVVLLRAPNDFASSTGGVTFNKGSATGTLTMQIGNGNSLITLDNLVVSNFVVNYSNQYVDGVCPLYVSAQVSFTYIGKYLRSHIKTWNNNFAPEYAHSFDASNNN